MSVAHEWRQPETRGPIAPFWMECARCGARYFAKVDADPVSYAYAPAGSAFWTSVLNVPACTEALP